MATRYPVSRGFSTSVAPTGAGVAPIDTENARPFAGKMASVTAAATTASAAASAALTNQRAAFMDISNATAQPSRLGGGALKPLQQQPTSLVVPSGAGVGALPTARSSLVTARNGAASHFGTAAASTAAAVASSINLPVSSSSAAMAAASSRASSSSVHNTRTAVAAATGHSLHPQRAAAAASAVLPAASSVSSAIADITLSPRMDARDQDPQECPEYANDIYDFLKKLELTKLPAADYMRRQTDINEKMRSILIDWLIEVHYKFKLRPETLFLTVNIVDRFLNERLVTKPKLQLVGVTAMLIASKYEEVYAPEVRDFIYISAKTYTKDEILRMERLILSTLKFALTQPTAFPFLNRWNKAGESDMTTSRLSNYFCELGLLEYRMLEFKPSLCAAAALYLARRYTQVREPWTAQLQHYSEFSEAEVLPAAAILNECVKAAPTSKLASAFKKYASPKQDTVAKITTRVSVDF